MTGRVDLHNHTRYSNLRLRDALATPEQLIDRAIELGLSGIAITDHETVAGHIKANQYAQKIVETSPDFKVILGNEIYLVDERPSEKHWHFILIAKDAEGHHQLRELSSLAWLNSYSSKGMTRVDTLKEELKEIIEKNPGHLIASSACFLKGQKVLTKRGYKNIENIHQGDLVKNMFGEWENVIEPTSREYCGKGKKIRLQGRLDPILCTENHQLLVSSNSYAKWSTTKTSKVYWKEAKDLVLKKGSSKNYCLRPLNNNYSNDIYIFKKEYKYKLFPYCHTSERKSDTLDIIQLTPELMRLFGLWLGDG